MSAAQVEPLLHKAEYAHISVVTQRSAAVAALAAAAGPQSSPAEAAEAVARHGVVLAGNRADLGTVLERLERQGVDAAVGSPPPAIRAGRVRLPRDRVEVAAAEVRARGGQGHDDGDLSSLCLAAGTADGETVVTGTPEALAALQRELRKGEGVPLTPLAVSEQRQLGRLRVQLTEAQAESLVSVCALCVCVCARVCVIGTLFSWTHVLVHIGHCLAPSAPAFHPKLTLGWQSTAAGHRVVVTRGTGNNGEDVAVLSGYVDDLKAVYLNLQVLGVGSPDDDPLGADLDVSGEVLTTPRGGARPPSPPPVADPTPADKPKVNKAKAKAKAKDKAKAKAKEKVWRLFL